MNKMNIPAPFRMALPTPPLPPQVPAPPPPPPPPPPSITMKPQTADLSSDESEMDSSDEVRPLYFSKYQISVASVCHLLITYITVLQCSLPNTS